MRSMRTDTINQNLEIEEQLIEINEKVKIRILLINLQIREFEKSYFKIDEDIKYAD